MHKLEKQWDWGLIKCRGEQCAIPEGSDLSPSREDLELTNQGIGVLEPIREAGMGRLGRTRLQLSPSLQRRRVCSPEGQFHWQPWSGRY